jgi:hypothetical protein
MAIAIPRGREAALPFMAAFVREVQDNGLLEQDPARRGPAGAAKAR